MTDSLILQFNGKTPKIQESAFIAPGCSGILTYSAANAARLLHG